MAQTNHFFREIPGGVTASPGFRAAGVAAGLKEGRQDLGLLVSDVPAAAAGVFTTNCVRAACVKRTEAVIHQGGVLRAVVVNAGNANACTGPQGEEDCRRMQERVAETLGIPAEQVGVASTGVIGVPLPMDKVEAGIAKAAQCLTEDGGGDFAAAILTTDTCKKERALQLEIHGRTVTIGGAAKGSGMIHPNMATMLAFITTDAAVQPQALQRALREVTEKTFNRITVDGDTSTNDMVLLLANGQAGYPPLDEQDAEWERFKAALHALCLSLAQAIARDGEGATKLIEVTVKRAREETEAVQIAKTVAGSSLVKTAIFGTDANWGRIIAAAGRSGVPIDPDRVDVFLGSMLVCRQGMAVPFDEAAAKAYLQNDTVTVTVDLHAGSAEATAYGCDLTYDYVKINASYRS